MSTIAQKSAELINILPDEDQGLVYELVKKLVRAWDPDNTKLTPEEYADVMDAESEFLRGETVSHEDIDWN